MTLEIRGSIHLRGQQLSHEANEACVMTLSVLRDFILNLSAKILPMRRLHYKVKVSGIASPLRRSGPVQFDSGQEQTGFDVGECIKI